MRRIVCSIAFFRQMLSVQLVFTSTKSRRKFYTQVERQSFHTASTHNGHGARAQNGKAHIWKRVACGADCRGRDGGRHGDQATNKMPPRCADPCAKPRYIHTEFCLLQQSTRTDPECPPAM